MTALSIQKRIHSKITAIFCLTVLMIIVLAGNAFPANTYTMVVGDGSSVEKTTFAWNETPWILVQLDSAVNGEDHVHVNLTDPGATLWYG